MSLKIHFQATHNHVTINKNQDFESKIQEKEARKNSRPKDVP